MRAIRTTILILMTAVVSMATYHVLGVSTWFDAGSGAAPSKLPAEAAERKIHAIGTLQPADGVITVFATPGSRVENLEISDGTHVDKDQSLGKLDSSELLLDQLNLLKKKKLAAKAKIDADIKLAEVQLRKVELTLEQAEEQKEDNLKLKGQEVALLRRKADLASNRAEALTKLKEKDDELVSASELESLQFAADTSTLEWELANLTLQFAERSADRNIEVVRANRDAAAALLNQLNDKTALEVLDAEIKVARQKSEASELKAPAAGTILKTYVSAGQTVTQMPILRMADLDHMECIAEVYDSAAKSIAPGQKVKIRSPAFKAPFDKEGIEGTVSRVGKMVESPGLSNPNPLAQSAKRVVEVSITFDLDPKSESIESLQLVDLQVNVEFVPPKKP